MSVWIYSFGDIGHSGNVPIVHRSASVLLFPQQFQPSESRDSRSHKELYCSYASCHGARQRKGCSVEDRGKGILHCLANFKSQAVRTCGFYQVLWA
ncbi:uncharacterized [Tachysurus ichikawai]